MREKIKSYLVFTSLIYRLMMYALLPLLLVVFQFMFLKIMDGSGVPIIVMALIFVEIVADNWFLGGIQEKNAEKIDYLKTSPRGMKVMENALVMDFVRRFLAAVVIFGICNLLSRLFGGEDDFQSVGVLLFSILVTYSLSVLGTLIARFGSYLWVSLIIGYFAAIIGLICCIFLMFGASIMMLNTILAVLAIIVSILAVKIAMKRVKGGYYDK